MPAQSFLPAFTTPAHFSIAGFAIILLLPAFDAVAMMLVPARNAMVAVVAMILVRLFIVNLLDRSGLDSFEFGRDINEYVVVSEKVTKIMK